MDNKTIELHTIATFQGKEYELENLLNGLLNKLEEKDKEIERSNNIINEVKDYVKFLILFNQTINGKFSETVWGREILDLLEDNIELVELKEGKQ